MAAMPPPPFWPKPNRFRVALRDGGPPPVAMWITLQSPNIVELVGAHGVEPCFIGCARIDEVGAAGLDEALHPAGGRRDHRGMDDRSRVVHGPGLGLLDLCLLGIGGAKS